MTIPRRSLKCAVTAAKKLDERTFRYVVSTEEADCEGDVILASAWKLDDYRQTPVVLLYHDPSRPVAVATRVAVEARQLVADVRFPPEGASRDSDEAFALVQSGVLTGASVGFMIDEWEPLATGGRKVTRARLLEISLVSLACNHSARRVASRPPLQTRQLRPQLAVKDVPSYVRTVARKALHSVAVERLCAHTGALDEEGLVEAARSRPGAGEAILRVFAAADRKAEEIASSVAKRLEAP